MRVGGLKNPLARAGGEGTQRTVTRVCYQHGYSRRRTLIRRSEVPFASTRDRFRLAHRVIELRLQAQATEHGGSRTTMAEESCPRREIRKSRQSRGRPVEWPVRAAKNL